MMRLLTAAGLIGAFTALAAALPAEKTTEHLRAVTEIATQRAQLSARPENRQQAVAPYEATTRRVTVTASVSSNALKQSERHASEATSAGTVGTVETFAGPRDDGTTRLRASEPTIAMSAPATVRIASARPRNANATRALIGDIQSELRRVGCYRGGITRAWTAKTQHAMSRFVRAVNARLPVERPDFILLALVRGETRDVCGSPSTITAAAPIRSDRLNFVSGHSPRRAQPPAAASRTVAPSKQPRAVVAKPRPRPVRVAKSAPITTGAVLSRPVATVQTPLSDRIAGSSAPLLPTRRPSERRIQLAAVTPTAPATSSATAAPSTATDARPSLTTTAPRPQTAPENTRRLQAREVNRPTPSTRRKQRTRRAKARRTRRASRRSRRYTPPSRLGRRPQSRRNRPGRIARYRARNRGFTASRFFSRVGNDR